MSEETDFYGDLELTGSNLASQSLRSELDEIKQKLDVMTTMHEEKARKVDRLINQNAVLIRNISILYNTAKLEIQRKNSQLAELRGLPQPERQAAQAVENAKAQLKKGEQSNAKIAFWDSSKNPLSDNIGFTDESESLTLVGPDDSQSVPNPLVPPISFRPSAPVPFTVHPILPMTPFQATSIDSESKRERGRRGGSKKK